MDNFDPYNVFLAIATNIPQQLKTGFVVQGHKYGYITKYISVCISCISALVQTDQTQCKPEHTKDAPCPRPFLNFSNKVFSAILRM